MSTGVSVLEGTPTWPNGRNSYLYKKAARRKYDEFGLLGALPQPLPIYYPDQGIKASTGALPAPAGRVKAISSISTAAEAVDYARAGYAAAVKAFAAAPLERKSVYETPARRYRFVSDAQAWRAKLTLTPAEDLAWRIHLKVLLDKADKTMDTARGSAPVAAGPKPKPQPQPSPSPEIDARPVTPEVDPVDPAPPASTDWLALLTSPKVLIPTGIGLLLVGYFVLKD